MFYKCLGAVVVLGAVACLTSAASAQQVFVYQPMAPAVVTLAPVVPAQVIAPVPPVVAFRPFFGPPAVTAFSPVVVARPVLVRTKVYVAGQPVRNFLRAITP